MIIKPFVSSSKLGILHGHFRYLTVCQVAGDRIWRGSGPSPWPDLPLEDIYGTVSMWNRDYGELIDHLSPHSLS